MSITLKSTLAGALCGAFVFAIAPADLGWAQDGCPPRCELGCKSGETCVGGHQVGHGCIIGGHCQPNKATLPAPKTNVGLAVVSVGREVYVFATAENGHVLYTFFQTGGAGAGGWFDLGDKILTNAAPAAAAVPDPAGTYMFVYVRDITDGSIKVNQGSPDVFNWVGWD